MSSPVPNEQKRSLKFASHEQKKKKVGTPVGSAAERVKGKNVKIEKRGSKKRKRSFFSGRLEEIK